MPGRRSRPGVVRLEEKLQRKLHQSGIAGLGDLSELRAIGKIAVWIEELGVVEDVEELGTEINAPGFRKPNGFQYRKIGVADVRSAADGTW